MPNPPSTPPILIIGAGITGLLLAQSLKSHCIPCEVFERDPNPEYRVVAYICRLLYIVYGSYSDIYDPEAGNVQYNGTLLVGCDGTRSRVRASLFPESHANYILPVRLLGVSTVYPSFLASKVRNLDPFFFQAGDPETNAFHWFSFLDSPSNNDREEKDSYECQILVSWPFKEGFMGKENPLDVPDGNLQRLEIMKEISEGWAEPFKTIVQMIPEGVDVKSIVLEDWVPPEAEVWKGVGGGRLVLVGDAGHAMTMFRGEAANHGIMDVAVLLEKILPALKSTDPEGGMLESGIGEYVKEVSARTRPAVLNSRQACLDAHDYQAINDRSPLIARRVAVQGY